MHKKLRVGILVFNEVEVLDFAGPFEVFSLAEKDNKKLFEVITIGQFPEIISARNGLKISPNSSFADNPDIDILIVPGGYGAEEIEIKNSLLLDWIKNQHQKTQLTTSVCTGALLLAECGLLNHKKATTHWMDLDRLETEYPLVHVIRNVKYVDEQEIITSGGISAGINMSFYIIKNLYGVEIAKSTAKKMEYDIEIK
ncbi:DJ-1/PfpI family protein [Aquimarina pacifica]|uniref:DJ-1/PfpI family protein n=1 Tax=Aquimarina pacifica TaxID=1296415 RepID=UPI0004723D7D|nr:DJ-1/PfpI family protein [Aquimarina pacifica]